MSDGQTTGGMLPGFEPKPAPVYVNPPTDDVQPAPVRTVRIPEAAGAGDVLVPFGKYRGWPLHRIAAADHGYFRWLEKYAEKPELRAAMGAFKLTAHYVQIRERWKRARKAERFAARAFDAWRDR
jgi:hypothetical protein